MTCGRLSAPHIYSFKEINEISTADDLFTMKFKIILFINPDCRKYSIIPAQY